MMKKNPICLFVLLFVGVFASCSSERVVLFQDGTNALPMVALNANGKKGLIAKPEKSAYAYLAIDQQQLPLFGQRKSQWGGLSCWIHIAGDATQNATTKKNSGQAVPGQAAQGQAVQGQVAFGFLYQDDFDSSGKLKKQLADRPLARCVTTVVDGVIPAQESFTLSMVVPAQKLEQLRGVLVYSNTPVAISAAGLEPIKIGFQGGTSYHFSSGGGLWNRTAPLDDVDFSEGMADFQAATLSQTADGTMTPAINLHLSESPAMPETRSQQPQVQLNLGGENIRVRRSPGQRQVTLHCMGLENPYAPLVVEAGRNMVTGITMELVSAPVRSDGAVLEPLVTDPGMIPLWPQKAWRHRDYELFEWQQFPGLLFFDTADYQVQDDFFKRLAFFTEKTGYIGTLVSDKDLEGKHGFNAHDYRSETLAAFFTLAERTNFPLNQKELILRDILLHKGIIKKGATGYESGYGAVISLSQESAMYLRYTFVAHEGFHGIFFVREDFRRQVAAVYQNADPQSVRFLHRYFQLQASLNYNLEDSYLMHNEFMAYVLQQTVNRTGAYFADNLAQRGSMLRSEPELCSYIQSTKGEGFRLASEELSRFVFRNWGIEAGRVSLVSR